MQGPMQDLDAGLNAKAWHGASLSSDMTSSCLINRVRIVVEGRYTVQHEHENWARLLTFGTKFACSEENVLCWQWRFHWILKWKLHLAKMNNLPDAPWHWRHGAGPPEGGPNATASVALAKGRPWHLITLWVSNEEMHTSGLHNSESSQGQIDQHKFTGCKCLFRCSVEAFLKYNYYLMSGFYNIFCNWESFCQPHVYCGLHFFAGLV